MDRGRNSRSDDGTCPWTGDEKGESGGGRYVGKNFVFEDNFLDFISILFILEFKSIIKTIIKEEEENG